MTHLYLIQASKSHRLKIGIADDPAKRLASLQVGSPEQLMLLHSIPIPGDRIVSRRAAKKAESGLHARFGLFRLHGEWFNWHAAIVEHFEAMNLCVALGLDPVRSSRLHSKEGLEQMVKTRKADA